MMSTEERIRLLREAKPNTWIAFSSDETKLVGRGETYSEVVEDAEKNGEADPVLIKIPDNWEPRAYRLCA